MSADKRPSNLENMRTRSLAKDPGPRRAGAAAGAAHLASAGRPHPMIDHPGPGVPKPRLSRGQGSWCCFFPFH